LWEDDHEPIGGGTAGGAREICQDTEDVQTTSGGSVMGAEGSTDQHASVIKYGAESESPHDDSHPTTGEDSVLHFLNQDSVHNVLGWPGEKEG